MTLTGARMCRPRWSCLSVLPVRLPCIVLPVGPPCPTVVHPAAAAPQVMGFYMEKNRKFRFKGEAITEKALEAFAKTVVDGTAEAEFKSAPIPEDNKAGPGRSVHWRGPRRASGDCPGTIAMQAFRAGPC